MTGFINIALSAIKWPVAVLAMAALPALIISLFQVLASGQGNPTRLGLFLLGALVYFFLDKLIFRRHAVGSWFSTFEHEVTHAVFAWLTLHRVTGMRVTYRKGGHVTFVGGGNWLIYIAPYWFPTLCIPLMFYPVFFNGSNPWWAGLLGFVFMFHHISTWRETHTDQSDLHETGLVFAWMFLPPANILSAGIVIAYAYGHTALVATFLKLTFDTLSVYSAFLLGI